MDSKKVIMLKNNKPIYLKYSIIRSMGDNKLEHKNEYDSKIYLSLAERTDARSEDIEYTFCEFFLGISFNIPVGYYLEINGTDSLIKRGFWLPHPIFVFPKQTDEIKVRLYKIKDTGEDILLPFRNCLVGILHDSNYHFLQSESKQVISNNSNNERSFNDYTSVESKQKDFFA